MTFTGQIALVTGGNSGIGRAIALQLAEAGATVVIAGRDRAKCEAVQDELAGRGHSAMIFAADLSEAAAAGRLIRMIDEAYGALQVLVNCAGGGGRKMGIAPGDSPLDRWNKMSNGNFLNAYLVTLAGVELMKRTGGAIVNISSTASLHGNYGLYGAMKTGLEGLTRSWAVEYAPLRIRVNAVAPGWIRVSEPLGTLPDPADPAQSEFEKTASVLARMGEPAEVAAAVLFLASAAASFITGATLFVDGGLSIVDPTAEGWLKAVKRSSI